MFGEVKSIKLPYPYLIAPTGFREIANPFHTIVVALLENLQESDQKTRRGKHEYLKVNVDRRSRPGLAVCYCRE